MKKSFIFFILINFSLICFSQYDEHVLLNLSLDSVFSKISDTEPGGTIFIQQNNQILYSKNFGLANLKTKNKFNESTVSNIGSFTEMFIAYSIFILQKQNKLSIEDSIIKYFPEIKTKKGVEKVQICHLLTHTSGLANVSVTKNFSITLIDQTDFEPGSNYRYSNADFNILALIVEKTSTMLWQSFIRENIFQLAGMTNSKIISQNDKDDEITTGYLKSNKIYKAIDNTTCYFESINCMNVWMSLNDLRKYINAVKECVFLDCETMAKFSQLPQFSNWRRSTPLPKGYSWFIRKLNEKDFVSEYESIQKGYVSNAMMYQQTGLTVIYLGNNNISYKEIIEKKLRNLKYIQ